MRIAGSTLLAILGAGIVAIAGCTSEVPTASEQSPPDVVAPSGANPTDPVTSTSPPAAPSPHVSRPANGPAGAQAAMSIGYQGGPVMLGTPDVYFIWYGNWAGSTALTVLPDFMSNLGGSPYLKINSTYADSQGRAVTGDVHYAGSATDSYSRGKSLSDSDIELVVASALSSGALPTTTNAVYFVLTSADVRMAGFCNGFCGWHTNGSGSVLGNHIKYSFIGNPAQCPSSCSPYSPSPNGDVATDGMASILAHELEESLTDPELNGWVDSGSQENGDKCAWKFGQTYLTDTGAKANMRLGARDYLIQTNFDRITNLCELALPQTTPLAVTILSPAPSSTLTPGGPLDIMAHATGSAAATSGVVHWTAFGNTTDFAMTKNAAGDWELSTTMSAAAKAGSRTFTVTVGDTTGTKATSGATTLQVVP